VVACGNEAQFAVDLARESIGRFRIGRQERRDSMSGSFERVDNERADCAGERADPLLVAARNASRGLVGDFGREIGDSRTRSGATSRWNCRMTVGAKR